ncbi:hypothetical protein [Piscirickettsia litoralis]|uniref:Uncharacterized protein n=1 Tax=Piscirickettsia litoralis TaxID=1891921 RepID=A0ABX3ABG0_9GAMM|nr:hypothetical protein [Piscirickettsia litoralis]ODN43454.1 hypothetical protein BGC07_11655 [Piscirickettsia litoralis]
MPLSLNSQEFQKLKREFINFLAENSSLTPLKMKLVEKSKNIEDLCSALAKDQEDQSHESDRSVGLFCDFLNHSKYNRPTCHKISPTGDSYECRNPHYCVTPDLIAQLSPGADKLPPWVVRCMPRNVRACALDKRQLHVDSPAWPIADRHNRLELAYKPRQNELKTLSKKEVRKSTHHACVKAMEAVSQFLATGKRLEGPEWEGIRDEFYAALARYKEESPAAFKGLGKGVIQFFRSINRYLQQRQHRKDGRELDVMKRFLEELAPPDAQYQVDNGPVEAEAEFKVHDGLSEFRVAVPVSCAMEARKAAGADSSVARQVVHSGP